MSTSASISEGIERTTLRGWAVLLLNRLQLSSIVLSSFAFGVFLPFIKADLGLSPLEAGLLQGVWWITSSVMLIPFGAMFSRFSPTRLVRVSLLLVLPFMFIQGLATSFLTLFFARFFLVLFHAVAMPARPLLFQQWVSKPKYAIVNSIGLSQHSILLALGVSSSALLITTVGSWRTAYFIQGVFIAIQLLAWIVVARDDKAPIRGMQETLHEQQGSPLRALRSYPQAWLLGIVMFSLAAMWTSMVTFLPTLLLEERNVPITLGGPLVGFLYYGLIPGALMGGFLSRKVRNRKLLVLAPPLLNTLLGIAIALTPYPPLIAVFVTGLGLVWVAVPVLEILPFEFPGIQPRDVAVITSLVLTASGLGFAFGPMLTGSVTQITGSIQAGLLVVAGVTGVGIAAGALFPSSPATSA